MESSTAIGQAGQAITIDTRAVLARWSALSIDVETNPADDNRIFKLGAVRSDSNDYLTLGRAPGAAIVHQVNALTDGARVLVGHNLRRHDLPQLQRQFPRLACLQLPLIDTLEWSAMAFPANPYHRLVKGYKLLSDSRNDPLKDARITLDLLADEVQAFAAMHADDPLWLSLLHFLVAHDAPLDQCLRAVRTASAPDARTGGATALSRFGSICCSHRLARVPADLTADPDHRFALALALGWIRVSGGNSVLPIWVHRSLPLVRQLIVELREQDCKDPACRYCAEQHNPEHLLELHFGKPSFRPKPIAPDGSSLQRAIVTAGLAHKSLLAVLPTGGGKSICYQLPALVHYWRAGQLTVIVSPLQSLMKDQVDNLVAAGVMCAVTINGLLTPPERRAALDKIRLGDAGIVLVSPEQFRSRSFVEAIHMREIAAWVFDEAHCLSKWGHDFRTDYLYVARFVRESFGAQSAPIACFTATAKPDVIDDLASHFRESLGIELERFLGGHERVNLSYQVVEATKAQKAARIVELLRHELKDGGAAVIFCATRRTTETMAELVSAQGIHCAHFHGSLDAEIKKKVQNQFLGGELTVIAATNAFGMGVDKPDIRLVIHADIPGSLENYLQEAGRAGRDGDAARCVLLFDPEDVETQFRLSATSRLSTRDFSGLLRAVRKRAARLKAQEVVVSAKELLLDSSDTDIDIDSRDASTRVTTAIAWLERGGFLRRNENSTRVFPASLRVASLEEALARIEKAAVSQPNQAKYSAVAACLFRSIDPGGISTDELMLDSGIGAQECFRILHQLEQLGVLANDLGLSVRLNKGVRGAADIALQNVVQLERALLDLMSELAPDADVDGQAQSLALRPICSELRRRLELPEGDTRASPEAVLTCLRSMAENFGSGHEKRSLLQLRSRGRETLSVILRREWPRIREICERRRAVAQVVLARLLAEVPPSTREASLLIECKARDLLEAMDADLDLRGTLREPAVALEHALLWLHDNKVLELDKGRSVFRSAMTIELNAEAGNRRFSKEDFAPLEEFYRERTLQTHVMHEYARLGVEDARRASQLVGDYFTLPRKRFVRDWFKGRADLLELATTDESFRRIVDDLNHPVQQALVEKPERGNHLVLAGPGSGKTRVIVHRIAYLLRVRRVPPDSIIALAFNRSAASELRRRLLALAGEDARRVTVLTYHAMALRLTGTSLETAARLGREIDFDKLLKDATDLLEGRSDAFLAEDDARDQVLRGYEYIFVDEYQDIDEAQYALVSALAGRRLADADARLSIMAVGDDDQNIYAFKGANVEFIRRFQVDYSGEVTYLVENFRSTQNIIAASNHVIQRAKDRMKVDHPIRINAARASDPAGGRWQQMDSVSRGCVRSLVAPASANLQAQVVMQELERIRSIEPNVSWGEMAVLARTHKSLEPLYALCQTNGVRVELLSREGDRGRVAVVKLREGQQLIDLLRQRRSTLIRIRALLRWLHRQAAKERDNPHWRDLATTVEDFAAGSAVDSVTAQEVLDALYEATHDANRGGPSDALRLITAHGAKGLEFEHVVVMDCGDWPWDDENERRLLYVAMTRARQTLVAIRAEGGRNAYLTDLGTVDGVLEALPEPRPVYRTVLDRRFVRLSPADVDLGLAGRRPASDPIHGWIAAVKPGDSLHVENRSIFDSQGHAVGRLSKGCDLPSYRLDGVATAVMVRSREQTPPDYLSGVKTDRWEVPLGQVVIQPDGGIKGES